MADIAVQKRGHYATSACLGCRRRKHKCSTEQPCATCAHFGEECVYAEVDGRKPRTSYINGLRATVTTLEERVALLESLLAAEGIAIPEATASSANIPAAPIASTSTLSAIDMPIQRTRARAGDDEGEQSDEESAWVGEMDRLQLDEEGSLVFFGPTSARTFGSLSTEQTFASPPSGAVRPRQNELDYSRHLPGDLGISREVHDSVLQLFEAFFASWCRVVDMYAFRSDMRTCLSTSDGPVRTQEYSPLLHNAILAVGLRLWQGDQVQPFPELVVSRDGGVLQSADAEMASVICYNQARTFVETEAERPMMSTVRGLLLVASVNASLSKGTLGYVYCGTSMRMSAVLGLGIDCSKQVARGEIPAAMKVARDSLFYTIRVQETLWSISQGRALLTYRGEDHGIEAPPIDEAEDARPWQSPIIWTFPSVAPPHPLNAPSWISTTFHWTHRLSAIQDRILSFFYVKSSPSASETNYAELAHQLQAWETMLPPALQVTTATSGSPPPHVLTLLLTYQKTIILHNRPYFMRTEGAFAGAKERCLEAARTALVLLERYDALYGLSYAPLTSVQTAFMAGTCFLLDIRPRTGGAKRSRPSLASLDQCLVALRSMGKCFSYGISTAEILEGLRQRWAPWDSPPPSSLPLGSPSSFPSSFPTDFGLPSAGCEEALYPFTLDGPWAGQFGSYGELFGVGEYRPFLGFEGEGTSEPVPFSWASWDDRGM